MLRRAERGILAAMADIGSIVIVGGGEAAYHAAKTLREQGYEGKLAVVGAEGQPPYQRPPLSKGYLHGGQSREDLDFAPGSWYQEQRIDLRTATTVRSLDRAARQAVLADGTRLGYDRRLLVTGSRARTLPFRTHSSAVGDSKPLRDER